MLYRWRDAYRKEGRSGLARAKGRPAGTPNPAMPQPGTSAEETAKRQIAVLERKVGQQAVQLDFFKRAFKRVKESNQKSASAGATASTGDPAMMRGKAFDNRGMPTAVGLSRIGFYRHYQEHEPAQADVELRDAIQKVALENRFYGYRRVTAELTRQDWAVNHKRVLRLMRADNLLALRKRRYVLTTDSHHPFAIYPNLTPRLVVSAVNQLWVADITYIRLRESFLYLAVILDAHSRKAVGWELGNTLEASLAVAALQRALAERAIEPGIVHHSDRGVQYASNDYVALLEANGFLISMSRSGRIAPTTPKRESFMKTLKCEVYLKTHRDREEVRASIAHFIEEVYNRKRLHSSLGYLAPAEFEEAAARQLPV